MLTISIFIDTFYPHKIYHPLFNLGAEIQPVLHTADVISSTLMALYNQHQVAVRKLLFSMKAAESCYVTKLFPDSRILTVTNIGVTFLLSHYCMFLWTDGEWGIFQLYQ